MTIKQSGRQGGFALILALLALMLLTSLGLSLSTTTSTELQIASNHRWSEQARYNAEAGIEYGKQLLSTIQDWETILPPRRTAATDLWAPNATAAAVATTPAHSTPDAWSNPSRNNENWACDSRGYGVGYGVIIDNQVDPPFQYVTQVGGLALNGGFTLWVRRPVMWDPTDPTKLEEYPGIANPSPPAIGSGVLILVAEGVAPFNGGVASAGFSSRATQIIEILVSQGSTTTTTAQGTGGCSSRQGQAGGSAQGTNSQGCTALDGSSIIPALTGAANLGDGSLR